MEKTKLHYKALVFSSFLKKRYYLPTANTRLQRLQTPALKDPLPKKSFDFLSVFGLKTTPRMVTVCIFISSGPQTVMEHN